MFLDTHGIKKMLGWTGFNVYTIPHNRRDMVLASEGVIVLVIASFTGLPLCNHLPAIESTRWRGHPA